MEKDSQNQTIIFTDGASRGNPGPGGWGAVVVSGGRGEERVTELGGFWSNTTNNRMELMAAIQALFFSGKNSGPIVIYTDSSYVLRGATEWLAGWEANNWQTKTKKEVLNRDLWAELSRAMRNINQGQGSQIQKNGGRGSGERLEWRLLSGHVGVTGNERADKIATAFADGDDPNLFVGALKDYRVDILNVSPDATQKDKRTDSKSRSRSKAYSYVSKVNGEIKIHQTWEDCEKRVKGAKGARYKKAVSEEEEARLVEEFKT